MKLIFHFGQQKAGSTALQNTLYENRGFLAEQRILYPTPAAPHTDHGAVSRMVFEEDRWPRQISKRERNNPGKVSRQARVILRQVEEARRRSNYDTVVLSSEYFFRRLTPENVATISRLMTDGFDETRFVCYIRHPAPRYLSSCLQRVRHSATLPRPGSSGFVGVIESYAQAFPVTVRAHDPVALPMGDIVHDFVTTFLPNLDLDRLNRSRRDANPSLSAETAAILQEYRYAMYPDEDDVVYRNDSKLRDALLRIADEWDLDHRPELKPAVARYIEQQTADELAWLETEHNVTFPGYTPAPEDADTIDPKKLRWVHQVATVNRKHKIQLTSRIIHEFLTTTVPGPPALKLLFRKVVRRVRALRRSGS